MQAVRLIEFGVQRHAIQNEGVEDHGYSLARRIDGVELRHIIRAQIALGMHAGEQHRHMVLCRVERMARRFFSVTVGGTPRSMSLEPSSRIAASG